MTLAENKVVIVALLVLVVGLLYTSIRERSITGSYIDSDEQMFAADTSVAVPDEVSGPEEEVARLPSDLSSLRRPSRELPIARSFPDDSSGLSSAVLTTGESASFAGGVALLPPVPTGPPPSLAAVFHVDKHNSCEALPDTLKLAIGGC